MSDPLLSGRIDRMLCDSGDVPRPTGGRAQPRGMMYDACTRVLQLVAMPTTLAAGANAPPGGDVQHRDGPCAESPWNFQGGSAGGVADITHDRSCLGLIRLEGCLK
jgi:hypothetical protein